MLLLTVEYKLCWLIFLVCWTFSYNFRQNPTVHETGENRNVNIQIGDKAITADAQKDPEKRFTIRMGSCSETQFFSELFAQFTRLWRRSGGTREGNKSCSLLKKYVSEDKQVENNAQLNLKKKNLLWGTTQRWHFVGENNLYETISQRRRRR